MSTLLKIQKWYGYLTLSYVGILISEVIIATILLKHIPTAANAYLPNGYYMEASDLILHDLESILLIFIAVFFIPYIIVSIIFYVENNNKKRVFLSNVFVLISYLILFLIDYALPYGTIIWLSD